jgi:hypothetical protein
MINAVLSWSLTALAAAIIIIATGGNKLVMEVLGFIVSTFGSALLVAWLEGPQKDSE